MLGAVTLVSLFFGARSAIKGPPGGTFFRPVGAVPGWAELGILGRSLAGIKGVATEIAGAIGRGVSSLKEWWASRKGTTPEPGEVGQFEVPRRKTPVHDAATGVIVVDHAPFTPPQVLPDVVQVDVHRGRVPAAGPLLGRRVEDDLDV